MGSSGCVSAAAIVVCGLAAHAAAENAHMTVGLENGVYVAFSMEGDAAAKSGDMVYGFASDTISRALVDPSACAYFGYDVTVRPLEAGRVELSLGPLSTQGEGHVRRTMAQRAPQCSTPRAMASPAPRFPAPTILEDGQELSVDLLRNPATGATVSERIRVSRKGSGRTVVRHTPRGHSDEPAPDLRLEDLPLGVFPRSRLLINGRPQTGAAGCQGQLITLWFPSRERFVFSLVPREGFNFRKVGLIDVDRIVFTWDDVRYEWIGEEPVVGPGVRCPVWVLKDDHPPLFFANLKPGEFGCGAGTPDYLLKER